MEEPLEQEIDQEELDTETPEKEVEEQEVEEPAADEEAEVEEEERKPSRRESLRIQKLVSMLKQSNPQEVEAPRSASGLNYKEALEADDATIDQLEKDRREYGKSLYEQGLKQAESILFQSRLEMDAPRVEAKYPVLDKESPKFNPAVADALNTNYLEMVGYDPRTRTVKHANIRYSDYIESMMELSDEIASEKVSRTTKNIAKQAASTALRPSGGTAKRLNLNQAPQSMSDEELDAIIAQTVPTKKR